MKLNHRFDGGCPLLCDTEAGSHQLLIAISCYVGDLGDVHYALLDTASQWCILPAETALALGCEPLPGEPLIRMSTRLGRIEGWLERLPLRFPAVEGEPLEVDATWFVSPDWSGPMVIGWKGGLQRFRFALDPEEEVFYFGAP